MTKPLLLIDGDQFVYKATVAVEREVKWDDQNVVLGSNIEEAFDACMGMLNGVMSKLGSRRIQIAFTQGANFRKTVCETYKGNRLLTRKPLAYHEVLAKLKEKFKCYGVDGLEADDIMGIWQTRDPAQDTIIVSDDKDMKTIPGKLYRLKELSDISEAEADYNFFHQVLTGDTTDGYAGCPGIGPAGATKILTNLENPWPAIVAAYEKKGLGEDDALVQARLARILRHSDWNSESKTPIMWSPNA